jgi:hypothetical protein
MTTDSTPRLDKRDAQALLEELRARVPGYVPQWLPESGQPGWAISQVFIRYLQVLIERLNQAPDRNKLAFLDTLGISLLSAQAARAPIVFTAMPQTGDGRVPARTRVGAKVPGRSDPLIFETETDIALAGANLAEVVSLWPGKDSYVDHSAAVIGGQRFTLFESLQPVPHELYLAHEIHFALAGQATVEIQFYLSIAGSELLPLTWEYWDGQLWRGFKAFKSVKDATGADSLDGTEGLKRSGIIRLVVDCAETAKRKVNGMESYWIRARVSNMTPASGRVWPSIDRISIRSIVANPLYRFVLASEEALVADKGKLSVRGPAFANRSGNAELHGPRFYEVQPTVDGDIAAEWTGLVEGRYHLRIQQLGYAPFDYDFTLSDTAGLRLILQRSPEAGGVEAESAYADGQQLDLSKAFYPFGQQPQAGSSFFLKSPEAFTKPGAQITLTASGVDTPQAKFDNPTAAKLSVVAEVWDGEQWMNVDAPVKDLINLFTGLATTIEFYLPQRLAATKVDDKDGFWLRFRIASGGFARSRKININDKSDPLTVTEYLPQALEHLRIGYVYHSLQDSAQACLTHNDFQWQDHTDDARRQGSPFEPFSPVEDNTPALYLGFDKPLPADLISLYFDIQEVSGEIEGPVLRWEYFDGSAWLPLAVREETHNLALPGMVAALWPGVSTPPPAQVLNASGMKVHLTDPRDGPRFTPGDQIFIEQDGKGELVRVARSKGEVLTVKTPLGRDYANAQIGFARLPRFGTPRTWIRVRLQEDSDPRLAKVNGIYHNAVWVSQVQTFENEIIGSGTGQPKQAYFTRNAPVLPGQVIEVRELEGARAQVELPLLIQDLIVNGMSEADVRTVADRRTGQISQVWVRWHERPNLFFSGSDDRHYVIERSRGRINFGDNRYGRIPTLSTDNIMVRSYRAGGGLDGNVGVGAISQLLSGVLAKGITNPRAAEGGADGEPANAVLERGPLTLRNHRQALSSDDYEALAREASPAVAIARALPTTHPSGRPATGWVRLVIMPHSHEPRPQPSFELRRQVQEFLTARMSASAVGQLSVVGPSYLEVGVVAVVAPERLESGGLVLGSVTDALQRFLHPLHGGPEGRGWPFGRDVYLSDVAALLESVAGVDYVKTLELTLDNTPHGEVVPVPEDRIVVAGPLRVSLIGQGA